MAKSPVSLAKIPPKMTSSTGVPRSVLSTASDFN